MGGTPTPPFTESPLSFPEFFFPKRTKNDVFYQIRLKMDQKDYILNQKALKTYAKRQKMQFWDIKYLFFSGIGGYSPPPP